MTGASAGILSITFLSLFWAAANSLKPSAPAVANGQRIFIRSCASCHDAHGTTPKSGPGLKNYYREHPPPHSTDAAVRAVIQQGKGTMPAFSNLGKSQMDDLMAYLKTL